MMEISSRYHGSLMGKKYTAKSKVQNKNTIRPMPCAFKYNWNYTVLINGCEAHEICLFFTHRILMVPHIDIKVILLITGEVDLFMSMQSSPWLVCTCLVLSRKRDYP